MGKEKFMFRVRPFRDARDASCGNIGDAQMGYAYADPRTLVALRDPELAARLEARLSGKHVELFPVKRLSDKN